MNEHNPAPPPLDENFINDNTTNTTKPTDTTTEDNTMTDKTDNTDMTNVMDDANEENGTAFEQTSLSLQEFADSVNMDFDVFEGDGDIDDAPEVSLDLTLQPGSYVGQISMNALSETSVTVIKVDRGSNSDVEVSQVNIPIKLTGQISVEGDATPKLVNKMLFIRLFLAWADKETGEIKRNDKNVTQLYRLASAWYAAKYNSTCEKGKEITSKRAFVSLQKFSVLKVLAMVMHTAEGVENDTYMIIPVTKFIEKESYQKKDGKIVLDSEGNPVVAYEAREVNSINFNQHGKMLEAGDLMDDLSATI